MHILFFYALLVHISTWEDHVSTLRELFRLLQRVNFTVIPQSACLEQGHSSSLVIGLEGERSTLRTERGEEAATDREIIFQFVSFVTESTINATCPYTQKNKLEAGWEQDRTVSPNFHTNPDSRSTKYRTRFSIAEHEQPGFHSPLLDGSE
ncbi:hypothetical protein PoB_000535800 [Plakobranchus ocellatus]|uniref:Uncharacterized protein n=1 Tax=Plakobranchus ocellatus TaxID=259542 RepID=A0AAV3Y8T8_9GAST|nr:hypothetical protein PoB_000535800 [Plakobranchus ocellatus]